MTRPRRLLLWIALAALAAIGVARLHFDIEVLNLLPAKLPAVEGLKIYQEHFANARELVITVQSPDPAAAEEAARQVAFDLRAPTNLVAQVTWQPPWQEHPDQAAELIAYLWFNQPPALFDQLTNRFGGGAPEILSSARQQLATSMSPGDIARLSYDPFALTELPAAASGAAPSFGSGEDMFVSEDGTFRILFVQRSGPPGNFRDAQRWFASLQDLARNALGRAGLTNDVTLGYTGGPAFVSEISSGMQGDLTRSVGATVLVVALLFWWAHRRFTPLFWLLALLILTLVCTLALGGLLFGTVNVVSIGFAAILMGLAVDYGLVLYHEALHMPSASPGQVRKALAPSIYWSAATTASAFLMLNFGGLPGLAQLGSWVALGVSVAAVVMLRLYLMPLLGGRQTKPVGRDLRARRVPQTEVGAPGGRVLPGAALAGQQRSRMPAPLAWALTILVVLGCGVILALKRPALDYSTNSLRPKHSQAYATMDEIKNHIGREREPDWLIVSGSGAAEVAEKLNQIEPVLQSALSNQHLGSFTLPISLIPSPEYQRANRSTAARLASQSARLRDLTAQAGFTSNALAFTEGAMTTWARAAAVPPPFWPTNELSQWILNKVTAREDSTLYALGLVYPAHESRGAVSSETWADDLPKTGVWLAGWERIGADLLNVVQRDFWRVLLPVSVLLLITLRLAFKRWIEVGLSLAVLVFSALCLVAVMAALGWSWNLLNLLALPLLLGTGVDYSIHLQLALHRHGGDVVEVRRTTGRALLLCAGTTTAGFGSNAWSSNAGLESLGLVCATGIAISFLVSYLLLPPWWRAAAGLQSAKRPAGPSSLYSSTLWRAGLALVRLFPRPVCLAFARAFASGYWQLGTRRRQVVVQNLLPVLNHDPKEAAIKARSLFDEFAFKIVDLWRYEAGLDIKPLLGEATGWEHFEKASSHGRGVLLVTLHLGNWEFGAPWLARKDIPLQVITLAEPGATFTQLRQELRARRNIETLVIGNDPFAFLEIIKRLEAGAAVALLLDRPPPATSVEVELFGQPFAASVAAAELARATGCAVLPVYLPRINGLYAAHLLPPVEYDRAALRDRQARRQFTQEIMRAFEPAIRQHPGQWFHFVPVWPDQNT